MQIEQIFYSSLWVASFAIVWFNTDWFVHYTQLFNIFPKSCEDYLAYIAENPDKFFPDFLHYKSLNISNRFIKFVCKLVSCPFCFLPWLSALTFLYHNKLILVAPIYVISLYITLQIRKLTYTH